MHGVDQRGKFLVLGWLVREHGDALEADFQRWYGLDFGDLYRGTMTPRRAAALALNLPPGAVTWLEADLAAAWNIGEHLLAATVDQLAIANWQRTKDGQKGHKKPKPLTRPGEQKAGRRSSGQHDPDRLDRQIAAFRARQAERQRVKEG